jgi:isocitrate dehydrogenase
MSESKVALAPGDGIGPEITEAVISIFEAAKVPVIFEHVNMGHQVYSKGVSSGITPESMATIEKLGVLLKGPMETPKGKGLKSINVTARKVWNTYANKRVFRSLHGVDTPFSRAGIPIDITLVRENIEDTYGGIEHFLTHDVALCRRFITRPGSEQVHRYTFEMARQHGFKKVTCGHKANIMKLTDGLFLEVFYEVAKDYPQITASDVIVDDLAMKLVRRPDQFQVIVLPNLQGDIISDLCAGLVGGLGFAPSANIGDSVAIFEAVHGTAPDIAGKGIANPTSMLLSGLMLLRHLGLHGKAALIENALFATIESGIHTADFGSHETKPSTTKEFASAIIARLGSAPRHNSISEKQDDDIGVGAAKTCYVRSQHRILESPKISGRIVGIDIFVEITQQPTSVAAIIESILEAPYKLTLVSNRGTQVWPSGSLLTDCVNQYRVRIEIPSNRAATDVEMLKVAVSLAEHFKVCSTELLMEYDGVAGYSLAQGQ